MKHIPLTTLCVAISAVLLTACGGSGGSNPPAPTPIPNASGSGNAGNAGGAGGANSGAGSASTPEPKYKDVPTDENKKAEVSGIQEPAMGYGMELKLRNWIPGEQQEEHAQISTGDVVKLEGGLEHKPFDNSIWQNIKNSKEVQTAYNQEKQNIEDQIIRENKQRPKEEKFDEATLKAYIKKVLDDRLTELAKPIYEKNINDSHDKQNKARTRDLKYVRSGYIYRSGYSNIIPKKIAKTGFDGALFYQGEQTAKQLPVSEVKYKGTWDFMTDAKKGQSFSSFGGQAGNRYSAMSYHEYPSLLTDEKNKPNGYNGEYGHSSEFTVDFSKKSLKGKLFSNLQDRHKGDVTKTERYDIDANIHGNRFRGSATAHDKNDASKAKHPFTSDAKDRLEGGFYGPNAEELAGKFLTDDNKLFGVFGAKQEGEAKPTEAILDAYALGTFNKPGTTNPAFTANSKKELDNFGNAKKLVLGSTVIDLVPTNATAYVNEFKEKPESATNKAGETLMVNDEVIVKTYGKNFEYLKFGELSIGGSHSVFLQGERTATTGDKAVPTKGTAKYLGNWVGYITGKDTGTSTGKSFNEAQDIADFDIDFERKSVKGKLTTQGRQDPVFNITGQIAGNGWTGTASTTKADAGGYKIDSSSTGKSIVIRDAKVTGGFYGPNANEMGGSFTHNADDKVSVVFGTKKQQEVK
ncbi:transferrin-binding protein-like solute binding protein [Moraxella catarrhalis]|uniref:transferrin-binding protein-like solute binding protein n=1 Tax=Moraxella catarrhalis TaxID=480 RepID=UPI000EA975B4|nr:transferrin-binding protein-like solute binding protein [Moraxella catarrhalis]RKM32807.1 transferrin-binding protein-like solute binding protein [Moraxella catarrhalis]